jgi:hypothetical protein
MAISEINVRPVMMNVLMTHLHVAEHCPRRQVKVLLALDVPFGGAAKRQCVGLNKQAGLQSLFLYCFDLALIA